MGFSNFSNVIIGKILTRLIKNKLKIDMDITIEELEIEDGVDDTVCANVSAWLVMPKSEVLKLITKLKGE